MDFWFLIFLFSVALLVAVGGSLLLVGYVGTLPAALSFGWRNWVPALLVPIFGPLWFAVRHPFGRWTLRDKAAQRRSPLR